MVCLKINKIKQSVWEPYKKENKNILVIKDKEKNL